MGYVRAAYIIARQVIDFLTNEKKREQVLALIIGIVAFIILFVSLPFYILTTPIEAILEGIGASSDSGISDILNDFKSENPNFGIGGENVDISGEYVAGEIPLFLQTDPRWANYPYTHNTIKISGCGVTSLAMVVVGLTGDTSVNPMTMAKFSTDRGWAVSAGTSWALMTTGAREFGLNAEQVSYSVESIVSNLREGKVMITSMKPGTFTNYGHFIVLRGITEDGQILVNDPYSEKLSSKTWSPSLIANESKGAWAYSYDKPSTETEENGNISN